LELHITLDVKGIQPTITNKFYDMPLVHENQLCHEDMLRKISLSQQNLRRSNLAMLKFPS
jgi:hypothetical protein